MVAAAAVLCLCGGRGGYGNGNGGGGGGGEIEEGNGQRAGVEKGECDCEQDRISVPYIAFFSTIHNHSTLNPAWLG